MSLYHRCVHSTILSSTLTSTVRNCPVNLLARKVSLFGMMERLVFLSFFIVVTNASLEVDINSLEKQSTGSNVLIGKRNSALLLAHNIV
uniref:Uncharacterized protein n=1 Tax=Daphnia galeata TaxID=27404 RepID=A0A8J2RV04_9CRUS|nr:unnamed protein product [Daphnia galeata]